MAMAIASCRVDGSTVYAYDENGGICWVNQFSMPVKATAFGTGVSVTSGNLCFTYMLRDGRLKQTGVYQS